jgi:hypothetical protein
MVVIVFMPQYNVYKYCKGYDKELMGEYAVATYSQQTKNKQNKYIGFHRYHWNINNYRSHKK